MSSDVRQRSKILSAGSMRSLFAATGVSLVPLLTIEPARLVPQQQCKEIEQISRIDAIDFVPAFEDSSWTVLEGFRGLFWLC